MAFFRNTFLPTVRRVACPSWGSFCILVGWGLWWAFLIIGASILMAVDNPRRESEGYLVGQGHVDYLDALYWLEVATTSCGLGDIVPVTDGGRAIIFIWSFIGTGIWGIIVGGIVIKLTNWIYVYILMASYYDIKKRKKEKKRARPMRSISKAEEGAEETLPEEERQEAEDDEEIEREKAYTTLENKTLPWYTMLFLNGVAVVFWFATHFVYAAVLWDVEDSIGNLGDLTPNNYGNVFYFSLIASQTICFGSDYNPKTREGRAFWLFWHPICMMANTFLFVTVTLALLRYLDDKTFWILGKIVRRIKQKSLSQETSDEIELEEGAESSTE